MAWGWVVVVALWAREGRATPRLEVQGGHTASIVGLSVSTNGRAVTLDGDGVILVWDLETGRRLAQLGSTEGEAHSVDLSPDGAFVVIGERGGKVSYWSVARRERVWLWGGNLDILPQVSFSEDADSVVVCDDYTTGLVALIDINTGIALGLPDDVSVNAHPWLSASGLLSLRDAHGADFWDMSAQQAPTLVARGPVLYDHLSGTWDRSNQLALTSKRRSVEVLDARTGETVQTLRAGLFARSPKLVQRGDGLAWFSSDGESVGILRPKSGFTVWSVQDRSRRRVPVARRTTVSEVRMLDGGGVLWLDELLPGRVRLCVNASKQESTRCIPVRGEGAIHRVAADERSGWALTFAGSEVYSVRLADLSMRRLGAAPEALEASFFHPTGELLMVSEHGRVWTASPEDSRIVYQRLLKEEDKVNVAAISVEGDTIGLGFGFQLYHGWYDITAAVSPGDGAGYGAVRTGSPRVFGWVGWSVAYQGHPELVAHGEYDADVLDWIATLQGSLYFPAHDGARALACEVGPFRCSIAERDSTRVTQLEGPHQRGHTGVAWSWDQARFATYHDENPVADLWETASGRLLSVLTIDIPVRQMDFSPDGRWLVATGTDGVVRLLECTDGRERLRIHVFPDGDWLVQTPDGRFDAAPGALSRHARWVDGDRVLDVAQIADQLYTPGLLRAVLSGDLALAPVIERPLAREPVVSLMTTEDGQRVAFSASSSGDGVGAFRLSVNGSDAAAFAEVSRSSDGALVANLDLERAPTWRPGRQNTVVAMAWSADGSLASRPQTLLVGEDLAPPTLPRVHALVVGVSDYEGTALDLRFPASDADALADALQLAIDRATESGWVGGGEVRRLTTTAGGQRPTRAALLDALAALQDTAPDDVVILYLAGHGISTEASDGGGYRFVTADAAVEAELADPLRRSAVSISVEELRDALLKTPASHRVLVLDTCAAGGAAGALASARALDAVRGSALARLERQTGTLVLAGSAADARSYESTLYGHGLLTYALLDGLRGPGLREGLFIDPLRWFGHAQEQVPALAASIGATQRPEIIAPFGGSFDVGELSAADRARIVLPAPRPRVARAVVTSAEPPWLDTAGLGEALNQTLLDESLLPTGRFALVDASAGAEAWRVRGTYRTDGDELVLQLVIVPPGGDAAEPITLRATPDALPALARQVRMAVVGAVEEEE